MLSHSSRHFRAATNLHRHLIAHHWTGRALVGPDCGVRLNYRVGRFIKSYLRGLPWRDHYYYLQAQGYWTLANWRLFELTGELTYRDIAVRCSASILAAQRPDGAWEYPNPEWKGRIASAEGTWASLGLLQTYKHTGARSFLNGALAWHQFLVDAIGFQRIGEELAVNYFADRTGSRVPNNSAFVLRFLAELSEVTGDRAYEQRCAGLLSFLQRVQLPSGEFPYTVAGADGGQYRPHFQCYQYNAFQCLDLVRYYQITRNAAALVPIAKVLNFLRDGLAEDGHALYECGNRHRQAPYHTAALAAALMEGSELGVDIHEDLPDLARRAYNYLFRTQRVDGGLPHSLRDYYLLSDRRSYPRNLSMILVHLLLGLRN
jgi:uncharacterized protein YyaL (SSP411 family)